MKTDSAHTRVLGLDSAAQSGNVSAREPQRIPNRLEHCPLVAGPQDAIPIYDGLRFHNFTPLTYSAGSEYAMHQEIDCFFSTSGGPCADTTMVEGSEFRVRQKGRSQAMPACRHDQQNSAG